MRPVAMAVLSLFAIHAGQVMPAAAQEVAAATPATPAGVVSERTVQVGDQVVHYLTAGSGPTTIVLLHGWPQSSHEWRRIMPLLAARYTVIAPDLRGVGGTSAPSDLYTKVALARDVHALVEQLGRGDVVVVGHDIGGMVAYAYARLFPDDLAGVAIMDVALPGLEPWSMAAGNPQVWHFTFHAQEPLAEQLVAGRQALYFRSFIDAHAVRPEAVPDSDVAVYAEAYRTDASLNAGFELYRAFPADEAFNTSRREPLDVPILLVGAEGSMGPLLPMLRDDLAAFGATDVEVAVIEASGHWVAEEQPEATAAAISGFVDGLWAWSGAQGRPRAGA